MSGSDYILFLRSLIRSRRRCNIASFAGGGHGSLVITSTGQTDQSPLLVHPHA
jgi:hypothetical protein